MRILITIASRAVTVIQSKWEYAVRKTTLLGRDPRAARPYLFSDGQNMYNRVVCMCVQSTYTYPLAWADGQFSGTRYNSYLRGCLTPTIGLALTKYIKIAP